jgi:tetratricopeptide (TPR) repeat protein
VAQAQARYDDAARLYQEVLSIREQLFGTESSLLTGVLRGLALVNLAKGHQDAAAALLTRVQMLEEKNSIPPGERAETAVLSATIQFKRGAVQEAAVQAAQGLKELDRSTPGYAMSRIEALNLLGVIARSRSDFQLAEQYHLDALTQIGDTAHPSKAAMWNNLGQVKTALGQWQEAESLYRRAIALWTEVYGPNHPDLASGLTNLAMLYGNRKKYTKAETMLRRALDMDVASVGSVSVKAAVDWNNLGYVAIRRRAFEDAESLFRRALAIYEKLLGPDHPDTGQELENLAIVCTQRKRYADAAPLFQRALAIRERAFGPLDAGLGKLLETYARVLRMNSDFAGAAQMEARAMRIQVQNLIHKNAPQAAGVLNSGEQH